jgi:hypothetical protein
VSSLHVSSGCWSDSCPLLAGALCRFEPPFSVEALLGAGEPGTPSSSVAGQHHAVPQLAGVIDCSNSSRASGRSGRAPGSPAISRTRRGRYSPHLPHRGSDRHLEGRAARGSTVRSRCFVISSAGRSDGKLIAEVPEIDVEKEPQNGLRWLMTTRAGTRRWQTSWSSRSSRAFAGRAARAPIGGRQPGLWCHPPGDRNRAGLPGVNVREI